MLLERFQVVLVTQLPPHHLVSLLRFLAAADVCVDALYHSLDPSTTLGNVAEAESGWGSSRRRHASAATHEYAQIYDDFGVRGADVAQRVLIVSTLNLGAVYASQIANSADSRREILGWQRLISSDQLSIARCWLCRACGG
eukprot:SAG11_NODE_539_length_8658_cov_8.164973_2_plen_141_part_00